MSIDFRINLEDYRVNACLECGRCTAVCPVARTRSFSPRFMLSKSISGGIESMSADPTVWACLTCRRCESICPADIPYSDLNLRTRALSNDIGVCSTCTHGGVFEQIGAVMTQPNLRQDRLGWVTKDLKVRKRGGDTLFFTGCSPYFAAYFGEPYSEKLLGALRATVRLMNRMDIRPLLLSDERCCGHDFQLRGELEPFHAVAAILAKQIRKAKVDRVVFNCPECLITLRDEYPRIVGDLDVELTHISELVSASVGELKFKSAELHATYQDPCRLGRYSGLYDEPRDAIRAVPGVELDEMSHSRERSICCGNTAWIGCDSGTKALQNRRLEEAEKTGSDTLLTSCPKCLIHLICATKSNGVYNGDNLEIRDTWEFVASQLD